MSLEELSRFYSNLAELEHSGISPLQAFEALKKGERRSQRLLQFQYVLQQIKKGRSLSQSLAFVKLIPVADLPLVKAAEESGRLVETFKILAKKYSDLNQAIRQIRSQLIKPFATLVVALFVPLLPELVSGRLSLLAYLIRSFGVLFVVLALVYVLNHLWMQSFFDYNQARRLQAILKGLPFIRGIRAMSALARFSLTWAIMLEAGIDAFSSLQQAAKASVKEDIEAAVRSILLKLKAGASLPTLFAAEPSFPQDLSSAVLLGYESGKLPEFLKRYSSRLEGQIDEQLQAFVKVFPMVIYLMIATYVAFLIISFYLERLNALNSIV